MSHSHTVSNTKKYILAGLVAFLVTGAGLYGYFLQQTVNAVVQRGEVSEQITQLRSQIGDAQQKYGTELGAATMERARELGFQSVQSSQYIARHSGEGALVLRDVTDNQ